jgi:hypothetical protein
MVSSCLSLMEVKKDCSKWQDCSSRRITDSAFLKLSPLNYPLRLWAHLLEKRMKVSPTYENPY